MTWNPDCTRMYMLRLAAIIGFVLLPAAHGFADGNVDSALSAVNPSANTGSMDIVCGKGETTLSIARKYLTQTSYMTPADLDHAIRVANHLSEKEQPKPCGKIVVPGIEPQP